MSILQFPMSLMLFVVFASGTYLLWRYLPEGKLRDFISGKLIFHISVSALALMTAVEGTWGIALHSSIPFFIAALLMMVSLAFAVLDSLRRKRGAASVFCHLGLLLVLSGAFFGAPDVVDATMEVWSDGKAVPLPFQLRLKEFRIDYYEDGISPKQYTGILDADGKELRTAVNHPCLYKGYRIYQVDYDRFSGRYVVLKLVKDLWMPLVYLGMILLAIGAVLSMKVEWNSRWLMVVTVALAVLFAVLSLVRINLGTLMPALRSFWFIPHIALYMLAYSTLVLASVSCIISPSRTGKLLSTSSSLLALGMICGAVWAKAAWGDWWTWDAKECWAAVSWFLTLGGMHIGGGSRRKDIALFVFVLAALLAMLTAWFGVEWLPASMNSMHTYR